MLTEDCQRKCGTFLSQFKEEIRRNPDTDVTPYTQMIADQFKEWNRECDERMIIIFFLKLYEYNVKSLRRDLCRLEPQEVLCKLRALDTSRARFRRRALLTGRCYKDYIDPERTLSWAIELCDQVEADQIRCEIDRGKYVIDERKSNYEQILSGFKEEVCRDTDNKFTPFTAEFTRFTDALVSEYGRACENRIEKMFFLNLYAGDAQSLRRDLLKMKFGRPQEPTPEQRSELLDSLYGAFSSYIGEDLSWIMAICDELEARELGQ